MDFSRKNIVILYMLYFGDMVSLSPFLHVLRKNAPGARIRLVCDARFNESVRYNPNVDEVIGADRKALGLAGTWRLGREIGRERPDVLFVLHGTARTSVMAAAMRPRCWTGEAGTRLDRFLMDREIFVERKDCHAAEKYVRALAELGIGDAGYEGMELFTAPAWEEAAEKFYETAGATQDDRLLGFSVGSSTAEKNWPAERFGAVADHFAAQGYRPVFFGVPSERPAIDRALSVMKHKDRAIVAAGALSMGEFIAAASRCRAAFTNDSGPMYVFDSRGVPTVAFFGPSNARLHHPLGRKSVALATTDFPAGQDHVAHTIRDKTYTPLTAISVGEAIRAGEWALGEKEAEEYETHCFFVNG